jgi:hypothetical protein
LHHRLDVWDETLILFEPLGKGLDFRAVVLCIKVKAQEGTYQEYKFDFLHPSFAVAGRPKFWLFKAGDW